MLTEHQVDMAAVMAGFDEDTAPAVIERFARAIESAACAPLLERIAALEAKLAQRVPDELGDDYLSELAHSANEEALSFGLSHDVFLRYFKTVRNRALAASPAAPEQQEPATVTMMKVPNNPATLAQLAAVRPDPIPEICGIAKAPNAQQAEAQPVAEVIIGDDEFDLGLTDDYAFGKLKLPNGRHMLYTAQPKAVPLTETQAREIWRNGVDHGDDWQDALGLIRATEAAHGIGA